MSVLTITNLSKSFGGVAAVVDGTFEIEQKKITALVGPNGAGKTTLFNIVSGLLSADTGSIFFCGKELTRTPAHERARAGISRTFQLTRLFRNLSIEDNLLLALRNDDDCFWRMLVRSNRADEEEKKKILEMMRFVEIEKDPKTPVIELSFGQQKLFGLARALLNPHTLLMLDEPVAGVNPVLRDKFKTLLCNLRTQGETIFLIEHDMDFVRAVADWVIVMDQGRVLMQGRPEEVMSDARVLEAYLGNY